MNHPKMTSLTTRSLIAAASAVFAGASTQALVIDSFGDTTAQVVASQAAGPVLSNSLVVTPFTFVGSRGLDADFGTGTFGTLGIVQNGTLQYANTPISAGQLIVNYESLTSADLTDAGASTGFLFTIDFADAPVNYSIFLTQFPGFSSSAQGTFPTEILNPGDQQTFFIPFAAFTGTADFSQINAISILLTPNNGVKGADLTLSEISTGVPEPTSLALLGLGGLALMRRRR